MDAFSAAVTAGGMILSYLDAYKAYSKEAEALYFRFKWDIRVMEAIVAYFQKRQAQTSDVQISPDDDRLLNDTAEYLAVLMGKVTGSLAKIQASGFWQRTLKRSLWIAKRGDLKELQRELREWTNRFDVRLLGLPPEVKTIIPVASTLAGDRFMPVLEANTRLQQFSALASNAKERQITELLCEPPGELLHEVEENYSSASHTLQLGTQQIILASRPFPPGVDPGSEEFQKFISDLGELSAALHCLEPSSGVSLLKVEYYFYHLNSRRFFFAHIPPHPVTRVVTLERMIEQAPYPHLITMPWLPVNQRLKLVQKLAEAIFFLHTAGFVHKNITPTSIVTIERSDLSHSRQFPYSAGDLYLLGFDMIRSSDGMTVLEGTYRSDSSGPSQKAADSERNFEVFQHPDRLQGADSKRYTKNHDIYSLGVVLLQVGLWEPINTVTRTLEDDRLEWPAELLEISLMLCPRMGNRYQKVVAWCLGLHGDTAVSDSSFVREVLEPLEDMAYALA